VTWICNSYPGGLSDETISGVHFVRIGPALGYTVFELFISYPLFLAHTILTAIGLLHRQKPDLVIDEIHGLPFFTPLYSRPRAALWVCEVAGPIWDKMYPWPVNTIGSWLEKLIYWLYRQTEIWAISQSTRSDILRLNPQAKVKVIPLGVDPVVMPRANKTAFPSAVFLARLVKMKGVETALMAARGIASQLLDFKLYLIGAGSPEYVAHLHNLVARLGITSNVEFLGRLSDSQRNRILARSHFLLHPSFKEGFGLTVLEAGLAGTPAIVRAGSSLDELVKPGVTGLVFTDESQIARLFLDHWQSSGYSGLSRQAQKLARRYLWPAVLNQSAKVTGL